MRKQFLTYMTRWFLLYRIYVNYCQQRKIKHFHEFYYILHVSLIYFLQKWNIYYLYSERNNETMSHYKIRQYYKTRNNVKITFFRLN